jgi:hypothetical protein
MSDLIFKTDGKETSRIPSRTIQELTIGTKCPETKLEVKKMTNQIEELKEKIATMQHNLKVLEKLEASKTDVEKAYRDTYGFYPITDISMGEWDAVSWDAFQKGWEAAQNNSQDISRVLIEGDDAYIMGAKYQRVEKQKPTTLYEIIGDWWDEIFTDGNPRGQNIETLVEQIEEWLPKEQSAKGSQNAYVECSVEGFNDALKKIKGKLR